MSIKSCVSHCSSLEWSCPLLFRSSFSKMSGQGKIAPTTSNPPKLQVKASPFLCLSRIKRKPNDSAELCLCCQVFPVCRSALVLWLSSAPACWCVSQCHVGACLMAHDIAHTLKATTRVSTDVVSKAYSLLALLRRWLRRQGLFVDMAQ